MLEFQKILIEIITDHNSKKKRMFLSTTFASGNQNFRNIRLKMARTKSNDKNFQKTPKKLCKMG